MENPFDEFDAAGALGGNPFDEFDERPAVPPSRLRRYVADPALSALKGAIGVPEAAVGLADLVTGGRAGKVAEDIGFRPKEARAFLDELYSPEQRAANEDVSGAHGFLDTLMAALRNPSTIAHSAIESAPAMLGGGVVARGAMRAVPRLAPLAAGALGEGTVSAGMSAEQIRQATEDGLLTPEQAAYASGSGALTGAIGGASGRLARRLGITDIDTLIAGGAGPASAKGVARRVGEGALSEGVLEELPQSLQEQALQNLALGKPVGEGVPEAGAMGMLVGGVMGGGANVFGGRTVDGEVTGREITPMARARAALADVQRAQERPAAQTAPAAPAPEPAVEVARRTAENLKAKAAGMAVPPTTTTEGASNADVPSVVPETAAGADAPPATAPGGAAAAAGTSAAPGTATDEATAGVLSGEPIDEAAHEAATSPQNDLEEPTEAQKAAGNYSKGHAKVGGLDISIENPAGSKRREEWGALSDHYGYVRGVPARAPDKDHVDVFVKPGTPEDFAGEVYVVDQQDKKGDYDEPKVVIGAANEAEARALYQRNYTPDWKGLRDITPMPMEQFKAKLQDPNAFMRPQRPQQWAKGAAPLETSAPAIDNPQAAIGNQKGDKAAPAEAGLSPEDRKRWESYRMATTTRGRRAGLKPVAPYVVGPKGELRKAKFGEALAAGEKLVWGADDMRELRSKRLSDHYREVRKPNPSKDSLNEWIAKRGGVDIKERVDISGDDKNIAFNTSQWLFTKKGAKIDDLARAAWEEGFLSHDEYGDVDGGVQALKDKIRAELGGKKHFSMAGQGGEDQMQARRDEELYLQADQYGIQTDGLTIEQVADAVQQHEEAQAVAAAADAGTPPDDWSTLSDEDKDARLDEIFGKADAPAAREGAGEAVAEGTLEPGEREPGADDEPSEAESEKPGEVAGDERPALELTQQTEEDLKAKEHQAAEGEAEQRAAAVRDRNDAILSPPAGTAPPAELQPQPTQQTGLFGVKVETRRAAYNPAQLELIYENADLRPGTTEEQKREGIAALKGLFHRDRRAGATLLGSALWKDFTERKGADLIGQQVQTAEDLAQLAQILRDPRFETLRIFFVKGDTVVGHTGITSRMPGVVAFVRGTDGADTAARFDARIAELQKMQDRLGADGYWMLHNHPSGRATPSGADQAVTEKVADALPGMLGHVVIDHNEYGHISPFGRSAVIQRNFGARVRNPEKPHDALGHTIQSPAGLAMLAHRMQAKTGYDVLVSVSASGAVSALAEVPHAMLIGTNRRDALRATARVRRFGRMTQASNVFVISESPDELRGIFSNGAARDVISASGETSSSLAARGVPVEGGAEYRSGALDAEEEKPAYSRQSENIDAYKLQSKQGKSQPLYWNGFIGLGKPDLEIGRGDERTVKYTIYDAKARDEKGLPVRLGDLRVDVNAEGKFTALRFIEIARGKRQKGLGWGETVVASLLAHNGPTPMRIFDIQHHTGDDWDALPFWRKMGTEFDNLSTDPNVEINGTLTLRRYLRARGAGVKLSRDGNERTAGETSGAVGEGRADGAGRRAVPGDRGNAPDAQEGGRRRGDDGGRYAAGSHLDDGSPAREQSSNAPRAGSASGRGAGDLAGDGQGLSTEAIRRLLAPAQAKWGNSPSVEVIGSMADAPAAVREHDEGLRQEGAKGAPTAFFYQGKVYVVADAVDTPHAAYRALFHEVLGHYGLRGAFGNDLTTILHDVVRSQPDTVRIKALEYGLDWNNEDHRLEAAEEVLAEIAQRRPHAGLVKRAIAAIRRFLRELGFDLKLSNNDIIVNYILPARRFVEGRKGEGAEAERPPSFERPGAWYFSALERSVRDLKQGAAPAEQWKATIKALKGVSKDEIEWSGVNEWLDTRTGKVTKDELLGYLAQNGVRIDEIVLSNEEREKTGTAETDSLKVELDALGYDVVDDEDVFGVRRRSDGAIISDSGFAERGADFGGYIEELPENVREKVQRLGHLLEMAEDPYADVPGRPRYEQYTLPGGGENYRELLLTLPNASSTKELDELTRQYDAGEIDKEAFLAKQSELNRRIKQTFRSTHFDQPNIIAHVRFNERTDTDGKKVLFLEELQSDWAQSRRRNLDLAESMESETGRENARRNADSRTPPAPFIGKTDAWVSLALKRMIRYGAEHGFERVAWTTGKQQTDRYSLRKSVKSIDWKKIKASEWAPGANAPARDGRRVTIALRGNGGYFNLFVANDGVVLAAGEHKDQFVDKRLEDVIGKTATDKIMGSPTGELKEEGLEIGGEGMLAFYDKILPNVANDILKKLGGRRVIDVRFDEPLSQPNERALREAERQGDSAAIADALGEGATAQPGFDITPALRDKALGGLPMFSRTQARDSDAFRNWFGDSKVVDEDGKPLVVYHGTTADFDAFKPETGWFSADPAEANLYGGMTTPGANVMPAYLSIRNPRYLEAADATRGAIWDAVSLLTKDEDGVIVRENGKVRWAIVTRPTQVKSATGNRGTFDSDSPDIRFSRSAASTPDAARAALARSAMPSARELFEDLTHSDRKLNRVISKFNTPFHIAETHPEFKPVYREAQDYSLDVSRIVNEAADLAKDLLPRIEGMADFKKKPPSNKDVETIADALYAGTLWGNGSPMEGRVWTDEELKAGRAIDNGVGFKAFQPLNDAQIGLYRQALESVGHSLTEHSKSLIWRLAKMKKIALDQGMSLDDMAETARQRVDDRITDIKAEFNTREERRTARMNAAEGAEVGAISKEGREDADKVQKQLDELEDFKASVTDIETKTKGLIEHGYFPAMRFGKYAVNVDKANPDGTREELYFGRFETQVAANMARRELQREFPGARVTSGVMNDEAHKLFQGLNLDALELFAEHLVDENGQKVSADPIMQQYFRVATTERSALKRQIHRKGVPGFSKDVPRALAQFTVSQATSASRSYHAAGMLEKVKGIKAGDLQAYATRYVRYLQDPQEEAAALRGFLANYYILGSIAFGAINMTQPLLMTAPYLTQYTGWAKSMAAMGKAAIDLVRGRKNLTEDEAEAYDKAAKAGVVSPQEIHQIRAETRASMLGDSPLWQKLEGIAETKGIRLPGKLLLRKAAFLWGSIYALTEQFNRGTTFIAAYRIAKETKQGNAYEFARMAVDATQGVYARTNRPEISRGAVGSIAMTFKQFSIGYIELAKRMYDKDKKAFAVLMLTLMALAGAEGLPFAEDIEDIIDTIGQWLGYGTNSRKKVRKLATEILGPDIADIMLHGASALPGVPFDVANRLGMHNLIPGSAILKSSEPDKTRDITDLLGPAATIFKNAGNALEGLATGKPGETKLLLPKAFQDVGKGLEMVETGAYRDTKGRKVMDVDALDAMVKFIGFQPAKVARETRIVGQNYQDIAMHKVIEDAIAGKWARALAEGDEEAIDEARQALRDWNEANPELRVVITRSQLRQRVKALRATRESRLTKSAPREMRGEVAQDLRQ